MISYLGLFYDLRAKINHVFRTNLGIPKNGSVPSFDRVRKTSTSERFKPSLAAIKASSRADVDGIPDVRKPKILKQSANSLIVPGSKSNMSNDAVSISFIFFFFPN